MADNLLDKASILLTPTAYNNGSMLSVKPTDGDGDFTFSRNSAATRVNAQGLVENVQILSGNLVQNGSFSQIGAEQITNGSFTNGSTDWTLQTGWSIGDGLALYDNSTTSIISQSFTWEVGKTYKITFDVGDFITNHRFDLSTGSTFIKGSTTDTDTSYTIYFEGDGGNTLRFRGFVNEIFSITNISVKEVGQNWNIENTWTIANSVANGNGANGDGEEIIQTSILVVGKEYKATYQVLNYASGSVALWKGIGVALIQRTANNTYTEYFTGASNQIRFRGTNFIGSITNIVIKEVTNDTNLPRINYEGFSYQDSFGSELITNGDFATNSYWQLGSGSSISGGSLNIISAPYNATTKQALSLTSGKTYKIVINAIAVGSADSNTFLLGFGDINGDQSILTQYEFEVGASVKTLTVTALATDATVIFRSRDASTSNLSITNVSVKEYLGQEVVPDSGCGSYILEPQSTNIYLNSETLSTQDNTTLASTYTVSFYGTGTITFSGTHTGSLVGTSLTDRVSATFTATAGTLTSTVSGTVTKGQLENLNFASSYIPTQGASSTRLQDIASNSGNSTLINSTEGVLYAEIKPNAIYNLQRWFSLSDGSHNNAVKIGFSNHTSDYRIACEVRSGGVSQAFMSKDFGAVAPEYVKVAIRYKENDFALWINGVEVVTDTSGVTPIGLNELTFTRGDGGQTFFGKTKALAVYKEALTDAELTLLTTI